MRQTFLFWGSTFLSTGQQDRKRLRSVIEALRYFRSLFGFGEVQSQQLFNVVNTFSSGYKKA